MRCPFLALSATIGNPGQLQSWWTSFNGIDTGGWPRVIDGISGDVQLGAMGVTPDALLSTRLVAERAALDSLGTVAAEEVEEAEEGEEVEFETWYTRPEGAKLGDIGLEFKHDADTRLFKVVRCSAPSFELGVRMGDFVMLVNGQAVPYGYDNEALTMHAPSRAMLWEMSEAAAGVSFAVPGASDAAAAAATPKL